MVGTDDGERKSHSYADYLRLDTLLSCQELQSDSRNELLFIIIHQSKELWFKLLIHELQQAISALFEGRALPAYKMLNRVSRIESLLVHEQEQRLGLHDQHQHGLLVVVIEMLVDGAVGNDQAIAGHVIELHAVVDVVPPALEHIEHGAVHVAVLLVGRHQPGKEARP